MLNILLLGGGLQGLSCGESLSNKKNYSVAAVSCGLDIIHSRLFDKVFQIKDLGYEETIRKIFGDAHYDVIIPMGDNAASFLSKQKSEIERQYNTKCAVADYKSLSIVEDKASFMRFCRENGFPHPKTTKLSSKNLESAAKEIGFPALIKPDFSVGARGITRVGSLEELQQQYPVISEKYGSCTLQEFIDNPDYYYNVMLYRDKNGDMSHYAITKIVRMYPVKAGSSSCCHTIENRELLEICRNVLEKLEWVGMADFDVLQRLDTKEYKIIEINPRVPASLRAAYVSGVNFPEIIVCDALGIQSNKQTYTPGMTLRYLGIDLMWLVKSPKRFKKIFSWLHFFGRKVFYQDIIWSDPSTWYSWFVVGMKKIGRRNRVIRTRQL